MCSTGGFTLESEVRTQKGVPGLSPVHQAAGCSVRAGAAGSTWAGWGCPQASAPARGMLHSTGAAAFIPLLPPALRWGLGIVLPFV